MGNRLRRVAGAGTALAAVVGMCVVGMASAEAASVAVAEGETFKAPYGASVKTDATASGGRYLLVDSNVTATGKTTCVGAANQLVVTEHGEGATKVTVYVDGSQVAAQYLTSKTFTKYIIQGSWGAGAHTVGVHLSNAATQNLYLDKVEFGSTVVTTPTPTPAPGERIIPSAYTTGYTWFDNTPPGSGDISHPVLHDKAGGTGTYADPITVAVGHSMATGKDVLDYPAGTRFYLPYVRRYFIVEDTCGDGSTPQNVPCHNLATAQKGATTWIDLYVGGGSGDNRSAVTACAETITALHQLIINPASNYPVVVGPLFQSGQCTRLY